MGPADAAATKKFFGFAENQSFYVPDDALANWRKAVKRGAMQEAEWNRLFASYANAFPEFAGGVRADTGRQVARRMEEGDSELHDRETGGDAQRGPAGNGRDLQ